jgi:hypothetical protein
VNNVFFWLILRRMAGGICGAFAVFLESGGNPAGRSNAAVEMNEGCRMQKRFCRLSSVCD